MQASLEVATACQFPNTNSYIYVGMVNQNDSKAKL